MNKQEISIIQAKLEGLNTSLSNEWKISKKKGRNYSTIKYIYEEQEKYKQQLKQLETCK